MPEPTQTGPHLSDIRDVARSLALDHYLAALLAPAAARDDLVTLAAWWGETGRISQSVSEPTLAEVRLQWWRDALQPDAGPSGHPVADALQSVITRRSLDRSLIDRVLDARSRELVDVPFDGEGELSAYLADTDGAFAALKASILGVTTDDAGAATLEAAAQSYGRARIGLALPHWAAYGRMVPPDTGDAAHTGRRAVSALAAGARVARRQLIDRRGAISPPLIDAILPVALVEPYLRALESLRHDPLRDLADISPLGRVARLAWARIRGRV